MQAIILAAGMGKRLKELTNDRAKCMVKVNDVSIIERTMNYLEKLKLKRIIIVIGYKSEKLFNFINSLEYNTPVEYINNNIYNKTNNIYSLYLAKDKLAEDDTLLIESDIIFQESILMKLVNHPYPNLALVARFESWMDGTVMKVDADKNIKMIVSKKEFKYSDMEEYYKTVNIYKFSKAFSSTHYIPFLEAYINALGNNEYYEQVLKVISILDKPNIKVLSLDHETWYEIDDEQDLDIAESLFAEDEKKYDAYIRRYGGYWRYPGMLDYCYLVNPYYPSDRMVDEIMSNFKQLLINYPSSMDVNCIVAAKIFGLRKDQICVGNGASELIKSITGILDGKVGVIFPSFQEYASRLGISNIERFMPNNSNYHYTADDVINYFKNKSVGSIVIVNPENPSGNYISRAEIVRISKWTKNKGIKLIIDESFSDFVEDISETSLLDRELLIDNPNLIVIKSISKSHGVPGLRLGIVATGDIEFIQRIKKDIAIWNVNSFGEFYLQIVEKYKESFTDALVKFKLARALMANELSKFSCLRVIPSEANFIMCEIGKPFTSRELAVELLAKNNILIKDLSTKNGFDGRSYIRLAVKTAEENSRLMGAIREIISHKSEQ